MKILFVCKANVGRSQVGEALFNRFSNKNTAISAGTHAYNGKYVGEIGSVTTKCMQEN